MKCSNCKIKINGNLSHCPLCNKELTGKRTENVFPNIKNIKSSLLSKILLLVSIYICIISFFIEYYFARHLYISKFISFGLLTNYILMVFILKNYKNVLKRMNKYFFLIFFLLVFWYFITKSLIITTFFIPILCIIIYIFNIITMLIYRNSYIIKYTKTIILSTLVGLFPLLFVFLKLSTFPLISYISVLIDVMTFLGLLFFFKDNVLEELKKMFSF